MSLLPGMKAASSFAATAAAKYAEDRLHDVVSPPLMTTSGGTVPYESMLSTPEHVYGMPVIMLMELQTVLAEKDLTLRYVIDSIKEV